VQVAVPVRSQTGGLVAQHVLQRLDVRTTDQPKPGKTNTD
jgi:hypothetical protein